MAKFAERHVELALAEVIFSEVRELAVEETSKARGNDHVTVAADAERRGVTRFD